MSTDDKVKPKTEEQAREDKRLREFISEHFSRFERVFRRYGEPSLRLVFSVDLFTGGCDKRYMVNKTDLIFGNQTKHLSAHEVFSCVKEIFTTLPYIRDEMGNLFASAIQEGSENPHTFHESALKLEIAKFPPSILPIPIASDKTMMPDVPDTRKARCDALHQIESEEYTKHSDEQAPQECSKEALEEKEIVPNFSDLKDNGQTQTESEVQAETEKVQINTPGSSLKVGTISSERLNNYEETQKPLKKYTSPNSELHNAKPLRYSSYGRPPTLGVDLRDTFTEDDEDEEFQPTTSQKTMKIKRSTRRRKRKSSQNDNDNEGEILYESPECKDTSKSGEKSDVRNVRYIFKSLTESGDMLIDIKMKNGTAANLPVIVTKLPRAGQNEVVGNGDKITSVGDKIENNSHDAQLGIDNETSTQQYAEESHLENERNEIEAVEGSHMDQAPEDPTMLPHHDIRKLDNRQQFEKSIEGHKLINAQDSNSDKSCHHGSVVPKLEIFDELVSEQYNSEESNDAPRPLSAGQATTSEESNIIEDTNKKQKYSGSKQISHDIKEELVEEQTNRALKVGMNDNNIETNSNLNENYADHLEFNDEENPSVYAPKTWIDVYRNGARLRNYLLKFPIDNDWMNIIRPNSEAYIPLLSSNIKKDNCMKNLEEYYGEFKNSILYSQPTEQEIKACEIYFESRRRYMTFLSFPRSIIGDVDFYRTGTLNRSGDNYTFADGSKAAITSEYPVDEYEKNPQLKKQNYKKFSPGNIVWVRYQGQYWPAFVLNLQLRGINKEHPSKRKMKLGKNSSEYPEELVIQVRYNVEEFGYVRYEDVDHFMWSFGIKYDSCRNDKKYVDSVVENIVRCRQIGYFEEFINHKVYEGLLRHNWDFDYLPKFQQLRFENPKDFFSFPDPVQMLELRSVMRRMRTDLFKLPNIIFESLQNKDKKKRRQKELLYQRIIDLHHFASYLENEKCVPDVFLPTQYVAQILEYNTMIPIENFNIYRPRCDDLVLKGYSCCSLKDRFPYEKRPHLIHAFPAYSYYNIHVTMSEFTSEEIPSTFSNRLNEVGELSLIETMYYSAMSMENRAKKLLHEQFVATRRKNYGIKPRNHNQLRRDNAPVDGEASSPTKNAVKRTQADEHSTQSPKKPKHH